MQKFKDDGDDFRATDEDRVFLENGKLIRGALGKNKYQTSKHLCLNTGLAVADVLDWLDHNSDEAAWEMVGQIRVYYLKINNPADLEIKLFFGGEDGRTLLTRKQPKHLSPTAPKVGDKLVVDHRRALDDRKHTRWGSLYAANMGKPAAVITNETEDFEDEDFEDEDFEEEKLTEKNEEKMENLTNENEREPAANDSAPESADKKRRVNASPLGSLLTAEIVEEAAFNGISTAKLAAQLGVVGDAPGKLIDAAIYSKKNQPLRDAWNRGKARRAETNGQTVHLPKSEPARKKAIELPEPPKNDLDQISDPNYVPVKTEILPVPDVPDKNHEPAEMPQIVKDKLNSPRVPVFGDRVEILGRVGQVRKQPRIVLKGDYFALTKRERELLPKIAELCDEFHNEKR